MAVRLAESVPGKFKAAITCFEDRRFDWHPGVDPLALGRASRHLRPGRGERGSTLTMQVVRLSRKGRPRTVAEKALEAALALRLTVASKAQVLGLFAAYAPFGGNTVGLDAAAWRYFGREAARCPGPRCAPLAVLPTPRPRAPRAQPRPLRDKRNRLLEALRDRGVIDGPTAASRSASRCRPLRRRPIRAAPVPRCGLERARPASAPATRAPGSARRSQGQERAAGSGPAPGHPGGSAAC